MTSRREFLQKSLLAGIGLTVLGKSALEAGNNTEAAHVLAPAKFKFSLPQLPYAYDALEPWIDKRTMEIHYTKHHQAYVDNLNKALDKKNEEQPGASGLTIPMPPGMLEASAVDTPADSLAGRAELEALLKNVSNEDPAIRNNAGGHWNHTFFWDSMRPAKKNPTPNVPAGKLKQHIEMTFGTFEEFKNKFAQAAKDRFGSGWAWLVKHEGNLVITSTPNQDNPLMDVAELFATPIIGLDVWEHAYYLKHQNVRADYINDWWNVVNWDRAAMLYEK